MRVRASGCCRRATECHGGSVRLSYVIFCFLLCFGSFGETTVVGLRKEMMPNCGELNQCSAPVPRKSLERDLEEEEGHRTMIACLPLNQWGGDGVVPAIGLDSRSRRKSDMIGLLWGQQHLSEWDSEEDGVLCTVQ